MPIDLWMMFLSLFITSTLAFLTRFTSLPCKVIYFVQICAESNSNDAQTCIGIRSSQYLKQYLWFRCLCNLKQTCTKVQKYCPGWKDGPHGKSKCVCKLDKGLSLDFTERLAKCQPVTSY